MPFTSAAWDAGNVESSQDAAAFCRCCLIDLNTGEKTKGACKLPIRSRPGGPINLNAMAAAAGALAGARGGLSAPPDAKRKAARRLARLYREAGQPVPQGVLRVAGARA